MSIGQGRIIKTYNGYYYVDSGTDELVTCKVKGKLKQIRFSLCTGDIVEFETNHNGESMITRILPRRNFMLRPTIANVDLIIVAFACINPDFSYLLADKLLVLAEQAGIPAVICLNKIDLAPAGLVAEIEAVYKRAGYEVYAISAQQGINVGKLKDRLYGKITVFAGPSGVGKSSTLNAIEPGMHAGDRQCQRKNRAGQTHHALCTPAAFCRRLSGRHSRFWQFEFRRTGR